ncbi:hypothetical protein NM74_13930 [Aeromonas hydrophila]|nr:hypothetical protein NM74_13930 [Aeromonas hydrophila]
MLFVERRIRLQEEMRRAQSSLISICCRAMTAWVRFLTPSFLKMAVMWALMVARGSVVLDIHLLQGDDRLGAVLDAKFSERWA